MPDLLPPADAQDLARRLLSAAAAAPADARWSARKVWLAYVQGRVPCSAAALVELARRGLVSLARADLVAAMPRELVETSEITDRGACWHFLLDPTAREPWEVAS